MTDRAPSDGPCLKGRPHHMKTVLDYQMCTTCRRLWVRPEAVYDPDCADCEFGTHRCRRCNGATGHAGVHVCPIPLGEI